MDVKLKPTFLTCVQTNLVETRAQKPWDLLDESVRGKEGVILLSQTLHLLLVLVKLLEVISRHAGDTLGLALIDMLLVTWK